MAGTGISPARVVAGPPSIDADREGSAPKPEVPAQVREGAHWFFWIAALATLNSLFTSMGSHIHRFTGFGVTAMMDRLAWPSGSSGAMYVIVNGWAGAGLLLLGYCAAKGQQWAFAVGMAAYAVDWALLVAAGDFVSAAFHAVVFCLVYRGLATLRQSPSSELSDAASAAYAG